ncbi:MAG: LysR family transcriptional regulator [Firmicutes bacterium]|nr:LysR family transcriptional regulator [Bacillota bacterium]
MIKYRALIQAIELGSITKAAKALGYSQPGVSHIIDSLEEKIGFPLLIKSNNRLQLTNTGKKLFPYFKKIVNAEDDMLSMAKSINGLMEGSIYIGAQNSMLVNLLPKIIAKFSEAYSSIELNIQEYPFENFAALLESGDIDISFMSESNIKGFEFHPLFKDSLCLIMNKDHPFTAYDKIPVSSLNGCDFIMPAPGWGDIVSIVSGKKEFSANTKYYTTSDTAAIAIVAENQGVYIMSSLHTSLLPENVVFREFEEDISRVMGFAIKSLKNTTPAILEFIRIAQQVVETELKKEGSILRPL